MSITPIIDNEQLTVNLCNVLVFSVLNNYQLSIIHYQLYKYSSVNSTQQQLRAVEDAAEGCVVLADFQTQGRGQQGNMWESEDGKNLLCSLLVTSQNLYAHNLFDLSRAVSLAVAHFLKEKNIDAKIKWSNDIFVQDDKIAGILIEPTIRGDRVLQAVVGIGLNVNQQHFTYAPRATSMLLILNELQNIETTLWAVLKQFSYFYGLLQTQQYQAIRNSYNDLLYRKTGMYKYCANGEIFSAKIITVSDDGDLVLQKEDGKIAQYCFKKVEFIFGDTEIAERHAIYRLK
ncbi:biotin--[acetyl-CoA-carboxylase] ligase [Bacteroidia bacterium]|nr:biotin--[acetyl-CoA-carboxylase] ligase [Bacteroidia bacterium]